jgi:hypothetical protein
MKFLLLALYALVAYSGPMLRPEPPRVPMPWMEAGNRRARRRDAKMARSA